MESVMRTVYFVIIKQQGRLREEDMQEMEYGATAGGLPDPGPRTRQKMTEWLYLQRFRENFADFPEGKVVSSERPDFLIKSQPRWIGIELTEYHVQEPDEGWGSPMRASANSVKANF